MICVIHGGQTGVDRGAHEAALANGWQIAGYMPRLRHDELGLIPDDVATHLVPYATGGYVDRTEANVRISDAVLVVALSARDPDMTPGTAMTVAFARDLHKRWKAVDPHTNPAEIGEWIASALHDLEAAAQAQRSLFGPRDPEPIFLRLMIAGPRESRWSGARAATVKLLRKVAHLRGELSSRRTA